MTDDAILEVETAAPEAVVVQEKMLPQSRVEELIKKAKLKGRDDMQEQLEAMRKENEALKAAPAQTIDTDAIRQQVYDDLVGQLQAQSEKEAQAQLQKEAERIAADYHGKMSLGKEQFDDFEEIMADFNPQAFPQLVYLASNTDNTASVMYELTKNPQKLATLAVLAERDPRSAQNMINKLSQSIKANEQAKAQEKSVNAPMSRMQSSPTGQDTGGQEIRDFKKMFRG